MPNTDKTILLPQLQRYDEKIKGWADGKLYQYDEMIKGWADNKFLTKVDMPSIPPATASTLGGVKVGNGLNVTDDGTLSVETHSNETSITTSITATDDSHNIITIDSSIRFIAGDFYCYIINYITKSVRKSLVVTWKITDANGNFILSSTKETSDFFQILPPIHTKSGEDDCRTTMGFLPRAKSAQAALASLLPVQDECEQMEAEVAKLEQDWIDDQDETVAVDRNGVPITIATKKTELEKKQAELEKLREDYFSKLGDWKNEVQE